MSLAKRLIRSLRVGKDKFFVGTDLEGNAFYERPSPEDPNDWRHSKRSIEYVEERPLSEYQFQSIPVQWSAWMRRTRRDPPTLDELKIDAARQERLKDNVERLRLAYIEEKERLRIGNEEMLRIGTNPVGEEASRDHAGEHTTGSLEQASPTSTATAPSSAEQAASDLGDSALAAKTSKQREVEREAAKARREEFARQNPTFGGKGNPGDTAKPDSWQPAPAPRRR